MVRAFLQALQADGGVALETDQDSVLLIINFLSWPILTVNFAAGKHLRNSFKNELFYSFCYAHCRTKSLGNGVLKYHQTRIYDIVKKI